MKKSRTVFISFLGTNPYSASRYVGKDPAVDVTTRFVQVATLKSVAHHFSPGDKVYIFTTTGALKNWEDQPIPGTKNEMDARLHSELRELEFAGDIENVHVEDGQTQEELWAIFTTIFEKLKEGDNLFFDITHGFRSLPLLTLVLINYAKFLKNITVSGIFYGAYDRNRWQSPIWNLTDFSKLQDWTNNANIFLRTGNAKGLAGQIEGEALAEIKQGLERFSEFTLVNRGMDIYKGSEIVKLGKEIDKVKGGADPAKKAVIPILKKVKDQFDGYQENSALNGFHAVRWCIQNGLIQQATTLLEEFVTSFVIELVGETEHLQNKDFRTFISGALSVGQDKLIYPTIESIQEDVLKATAQKVYDLKDYKKLQQLANQIKNSVRNDINHAGFRANPRDFSGLRNSILKRYNDLIKLLENRGYKLPKL